MSLEQRPEQPQSSEYTRTGIVEQMQRIAPPGQRRLSAETRANLTLLTQELLKLEGPHAASEYDRYHGVKDRELQLPRDRLSAQITGKTILVTGGTGLIGTTLLQQLSEYDPGKLVSVSRGDTVPKLIVPGVQYEQSDVRDAGSIGALMRAVKPDIVYHVAADKYNHEAEKRAAHTLSTNILGTRNVIVAAEASGVTEFIYASTGKATRPYSPDIYASSKKTGEWLMTQAAARGSMLCSAARFTHVVDGSNISRKIHEWINTDSPVALQGPEVWFYVQSAKESAQLLLNTGLEAVPDELHVQAIRDLELPINLAQLGLGAIAKRKSNTPIYFAGVMAGYEDEAWPLLYGLESGDYSPLINSIETSQCAESKTCPKIDSFPLQIAASDRLEESFAALQTALQTGVPATTLRELNQTFSWQMLDARLQKVPQTVLERIVKRTARLPMDTSHPEHQKTTDMFVAALAARQQ